MFSIFKKKTALPEVLRKELKAFLRENGEKPREFSVSRKANAALGRRVEEDRAEYCACVSREPSLEELLGNMDASFSQALMTLIDKSGKKDAQVYKKANLSRQHFSKIRSNPDYRPTKATAIALALALELDLEGTKDLIGRAGFSLSNSSRSDLIIRFFIQRGIYDVDRINMALYEFDQPLLGS